MILTSTLNPSWSITEESGHPRFPIPRAAVYADGGICLDILQNQWSPIYDVSAILTSIRVRALLQWFRTQLNDLRI